MKSNCPRLSRLATWAALIALTISCHSRALAEDGAEGEGEPVLLRYKFDKGEEVLTKVTHIATTKTKIRGNVQESKSRAISTKVWRIVDIDDKGNIEFEHLVSDVEMWQKVTGRDEVRYNSRKDDKPPLQYEHASKSIGKVIASLTITPTGKIVARKNNLPEHDMGLGPIATPLPEEPVQVGQRWVVPSEVTVRIKDSFKRIQTRKTFRLLSVKTGVATIEVKTQVLTPVDEPEIEAQLMQQLTNGKMKFDIDAGRVISKEMDWDETVVGFSGADSMMEYLARFQEEIAPNRTARRPE
ncbi:MAG: hypothetical protein KDB14_29405 [Planctomycetales bacterium]|nr:hypothetical protein [Planctomycetales bacterium]